jgi:hypothetical protein
MGTQCLCFEIQNLADSIPRPPEALLGYIDGCEWLHAIYLEYLSTEVVENIVPPFGFKFKVKRRKKCSL